MFISNLLLTAGFQESLDSIRAACEIIKVNTEGHFCDDFRLIAVLSFFISLASMIATMIVGYNVKRIDSNCQHGLFQDLVRHLYRNKLCTMAMRAKYNKLVGSQGKGYPSEEHYRKLQLLPEDIHLERYNHKSEIYNVLHDLEFMLRNYNTEIEVAERHMTDMNMNEDTKQRDFDTLEFKTGFLTKAIYDVMLKMRKGWFLRHLQDWTGVKDDEKEKPSDWLGGLCFSIIKKKRDAVALNIYGILESAHKENMKNNSRAECCWGDDFKEDIDALRKDENVKDSYFNSLFKDNPTYANGFRQFLDDDLLIECGKNKKGEDKIHIIKF